MTSTTPTERIADERSPARHGSTRRPVRTALCGLTLAAGLLVGGVACSSTPATDTADQAAAGTVQVTTTAGSDAPVSNEGDAEAGYDGGPLGQTAEAGTAPPTATSTAPPVSTAGPIAPAGSIDDVVAEVEVKTAAPVALQDAADFGGQVSARLTALTPIQATATVPGEISGPAVAVTVEIDNGSAEAIGLNSVTVTLTDAAGNPAGTISGDSAGALSGALGAGDTASGMYVFTVPSEARNPVTVTVSYSSDAPTVVFTGEVAGG